MTKNWLGYYSFWPIKNTMLLGKSILKKQKILITEFKFVARINTWIFALINRFGWGSFTWHILF